MGKQCLAEKVPGRLIPLPREISAGCGLAWKMPEEDYEKYKDEVESLNITVEQKVWLNYKNKEIGDHGIYWNRHWFYLCQGYCSG